MKLPKKAHLRSSADFKLVFDARTRDIAGPLAFHARVNDLPISRFGMSVSRKVGTAVQRNKIRRRLRESFRLLQHDLPNGLDVVVVVRPHAPLDLGEYQKLMRAAMQKLEKRSKR